MHRLKIVHYYFSQNRLAIGPDRICHEKATCYKVFRHFCVFCIQKNDGGSLLLRSAVSCFLVGFILNFYSQSFEPRRRWTNRVRSFQRFSNHVSNSSFVEDSSQRIFVITPYTLRPSFKQVTNGNLSFWEIYPIFSPSYKSLTASLS